jgi:Na+/H+ antiporter NhaD/arsenite permease-like protein
MEFVIATVFVIGYALIALEHPIKINKTASALLTGVLCWVLFAFATPTEALLHNELYTNFINESPGNYMGYVAESLGHHLKEIAEILFFLMGAMTIVELLDAHQSFHFITSKIKTRNPKKLLWLVCWVAFLLSAVLDNLTTTIVMISLVRKLVPKKDMRWFFVGMIILAANAGGAWSPIGDVTTTMLWIGGQISALGIIKATIIPSIVCILVPLLFLSVTLKGDLGAASENETIDDTTLPTSNFMLVLGLGALLFVPVFKTVTHLPPYMGMMFGLGVIWIASELINPDLDERERKHFSAASALGRIDMSSVLFFLGILLAVGALQSFGMLQNLAEYLAATLKDNRAIITLIGLLSAIVDNVPLVAASMGMYKLEVYPVDSTIWEYLAYCAGTGGSILIVGSAAGVAAMGMEKIEFGWYLKRISLLAALGYFSGAITYLLLHGGE